MTYTLTAEKRTGQAEAVRNQGKIPGVVYGRKSEPVSIAVDYNAFDALYEHAGTSSLISLAIGDASPVSVLIKDWEIDPIKQRFTHIDLYQVVMDEEIDAVVYLEFVGEPEAVRVQGGTLMTAMDSITVRCLPKDLVDHIDVDLTALATCDDVILIRDLKLPAGITCLDNEDVLVATVNAPLTEEELKKMETTESADITKVEVEEKGKKEEEGAEGAAEKK